MIIILTNGIGLVLTPFMIRMLGDSEFGLYSLIGALIGYITVLDLGLNNTIIRFTSKYRALKDSQGEQNFLATTMLIYIAISMVALLIGSFIFFNLDTIYSKLTPNEMEKAKSMFLILLINVAITLPGNAFQAICSAYEHFVFPKALNIIRYLVRSAMVVGLLLLGGDSVGIVILDTVVNILVILLTAYYVLFRLKVKFKLHQWQPDLVKQIFSYSIWIFVFAMVGIFQWKAGQAILGVISTTLAVAIYQVGITLGTYYGAFSTAISGVFLPRATKMTVQNVTPKELTDEMIRIGRFSFIALLLILGGFLLFGMQFVTLWVGNTYREAYSIALIIMFSYTIPLVQSFANSVLEARGLFYFKAMTYISLIALGTVFGTWLHGHFGLMGLIIGSTSGWVLSQLVMNIYYSSKLQLEITRFYKELLQKLLPSFLVVLIVGYGINYLPGEGWLNLSLKIFAFLCIFFFIVGKFGLKEAERQTLLSVMPGFLRKKLG